MRHTCRLFISLLEPDAAQTSIHLLRSSLPAKFRQPEMARTRGAKSSSPSSRKKVPRGETVTDPTSKPPRPKAVSPPVKPAPQKPPARRYLTRSGGRPLQKRARVESSEPIDLTEQSQNPRRFHLQFHLRCHLRRRQQSLRSLSHHFPSPKIHLR